MTTYDVQLYREILITFRDIEADSPEDAASTACEYATIEIDNIQDCDDLSARVDVADDVYRPPVFIDFEARRLRKAAPQLLAACRMVVDRWERGDLAEAARACSDAIAEATAPGQDGGRP